MELRQELLWTPAVPCIGAGLVQSSLYQRQAAGHRLVLYELLPLQLPLWIQNTEF